MYFIGVDDHKQVSVMTVLDEDGRERKNGRVPNLRRYVEQFLEDCRPFTAVLEAGRSSYVMAALLRELGGEVKIANALQVKAIAHARIKTDKRDSRMLAHLLRANLIPEVYQRRDGNRRAQRVIRMRAYWVCKQTEVKNKIRALLAHQREEVRLEVEKRESGLFAGVIPSTSSSGERTYHGPITKQGSRWLRWAALEAVYPAIKKDLVLRTLYSRLARRKGPNVAKIAVARRLLTIIYRILTEKREYIPGLMKQTAA